MTLIFKKTLRILFTLVKVFSYKNEDIAGDRSFCIGTSHWGVVYMYTQENLQCVF